MQEDETGEMAMGEQVRLRPNLFSAKGEYFTKAPC
jgi:hypothetical protein